jgi:hypothetical protein
MNDNQLEILQSKLIRLKQVSIRIDHKKRLSYQISFFNKKISITYYSENNILYNLHVKNLCIDIIEKNADLRCFTNAEHITILSSKKISIAFPKEVKSISISHPHKIQNMDELTSLKKISLYDFKSSKNKPLYDLSRIATLKEVEICDAQACLVIPLYLKMVCLANSNLFVRNKSVIGTLCAVNSNLVGAKCNVNDYCINNVSFGHNNEKELDKTQPDVRKEILDSLEKSISEFDVLYKKLSR